MNCTVCVICNAPVRSVIDSVKIIHKKRVHLECITRFLKFSYKCPMCGWDDCTWIPTQKQIRMAETVFANY